MPPEQEISRVSTESPSVARVTHQFDDFDLERFLLVAARFGNGRFGFVVTPNVDHLIRCAEDPLFHSCYTRADYILLDSRIASRLLWLMKGVRLPVCTGSDLTAALFARVIAPGDRIVVIGADREQVARLASTYSLTDIRHHNPPMGFIHDPAAVQECLTYIERASPFRFCFLAIGSPQQERIAEHLARRGAARGLTLCIGASLNFLTGRERRAPHWVQHLSLEWLYRLLHDPKRLSNRYLVRGPRIFAHLHHAQIVVRAPPPAADAPTVAAAPKIAVFVPRVGDHRTRTTADIR